MEISETFESFDRDGHNPQVLFFGFLPPLILSSDDASPRLRLRIGMGCALRSPVRVITLDFSRDTLSHLEVSFRQTLSFCSFHRPFVDTNAAKMRCLLILFLLFIFLFFLSSSSPCYNGRHFSFSHKKRKSRPSFFTSLMFIAFSSIFCYYLKKLGSWFSD